jgi:transposase InsO family protein
MRHLSTIQDRLKPITSIFRTSRRGHINSTICSLQHGLNHGLTSGGRKRLNLSRGRPRPFEGVILCPTTKTVTMDRIGDLLHENLYKQFGLPDKMISDQGPQFAAKAFRAMLSKLGVNLALSTAYHPQTDGTMEWVNQEIKAYLAIYCHFHLETWKKSLATLEFTHNNRRHADRPKTSFEIIQGELPKALPLTYENTKFPSIDDKVKQMMADRDEALAAHELA